MPQGVVTFGPFELRSDERLLLENGIPVRLGSRGFDLLTVLVERAGEIVAKDELIARVWPETTVDEANLRVHVAALRKALGESSKGVRFVANVPGRGYCFTAAVTGGRTEPDPGPSRPPPSKAAPPDLARGLPASLTRVIGRADQIQALVAQIRIRRLVTIVGPGGIGKTTVAAAVVEAVASSFRDGVAFLDLGPIVDPSLVAGALASVLELTGRSEEPAIALGAYLRDKTILLVLDGCEHVVGPVAALAEALLSAAPGVRLLATSTEPLRAHGEWVHRLPPLRVPQTAEAMTAAEALRFPAVELFVERADAALGGFELSDAEAPAVAELCRKLDGVALAIVLAAGRTDAFGPQELASLLDDRFRLLTRNRRTALPRHRTLSATLDWSHELLPEPERRALRRLAIFNGSFEMGSAIAVAQGLGVTALEVGDLVASLAAKSLVEAESTEGEVRFRLLDTTRAYARQKLAEAGEEQDVARRHAEHVREVFERAEGEWDRRPTPEWLGAYARQIDNLRAALDWAFSSAGDVNLGVALTATAVPLWCHLSLVDEGLGRVERAIAAFETTPEADEGRRTRLHAAHGWLQMYATTKLERSAAAWRTALELAEELGDRDYQLRALWALWADCQNRGAFRESLAMAHRFRALSAGSADAADRFVGDRMIGASLHFLGDQTEAREHIERMLDGYVAPTRRSHAVRFQFDQRVTARITLARILWLQGFPDRALQEIESNVADATGHALSLCNALAQSACPIALLAGDLAAAERFLAMLRRRTTEHALDVWRGYADCFEGELLVRRGETATGLRLLRAAIDELRRVGFVQYLTAFLATLAQSLAGSSRIEEALRAIEEALDRSDRNGERWCRAELLRLRGEIRRQVAPDSATAAEGDFLAALRIAREQRALSWELRAATSLASLRRDQRREQEAHDVLSPVYARFDEGFGTTDLARARALIEAMGRAPGV